MVGSVDKGTMGDNQVEGWPGAIISELHQKAALTLPKRPNVVIIQCGCKIKFTSYPTLLTIYSERHVKKD